MTASACDGERLVQLDQVDVVQGQAGQLEHLRDRRRPGRCPSPPARTPPTAKATKRASGFSPRARRVSRSITSTAAAPSLVCEELPAVTRAACGEDRLQLRQRLQRWYRGAAPRRCRRSTRGAALCRPRPPRSSSTVSGTISSLNLPSSIAAAARWCERQREGVLLLAADARTPARRSRRSGPCPGRRRGESRPASGSGRSVSPPSAPGSCSPRRPPGSQSPKPGHDPLGGLRDRLQARRSRSG